MKTEFTIRRRRDRGVAVVVVLAIISIVLVFVAANLRSLHRLGQEMRMIEKKQVHRLDLQAAGQAISNSPTNVAVSVSTPVSGVTNPK